MLERIRGCLLGGAAGDALGYEVEFISAEEIDRRFGSGGIQDMALHGGKALVSDDTQMTLFTCEGLIMGWNRAVSGGLAADMEVYVYEAYLNWLGTQGYKARGMWHEYSELLKRAELYHPRAPGNTCLGALLSGRMGTLAEAVNDSCGCGGVMRVSPVGFVAPFGRRYDDCPEDSFAWEGAKVAAITHGHPLGYMPAAMLADLIHLITLEDGRGLEEMIADSLSRVERLLGRDERQAAQTFRRMVEEAVAMSHGQMDDRKAIHALGGGWTGHEALAIALYCVLKYRDDFRACLRAAVNHSGDSDSTGAIAGNILGAYLGAAAVPQEWTACLDVVDAVEAMARELCQVGEEQKQ